MSFEGIRKAWTITPDELSNIVPLWNSPLPANKHGLLKAFTDGATGAKEYVNETGDRLKKMHGENLKNIPNVPVTILRNVRLWPLLLNGSTKTEYEKKEAE